MNDLKALKNVCLTLLVTFLLFLGIRVGAVIIEGFTTTGQFLSVQVSADGRLLVSNDPGLAQAVFFVSSQPVNAFQAGSWTVDISTPITISASSIVNVKLSTASNLSSAQITVNTSAQILSADATRTQSIVCNESLASSWIGPLGVTTANGVLLGPGACFSPDTPASFTGDLYAVSTSPVIVSKIEITQ